MQLICARIIPFSPSTVLTHGLSAFCPRLGFKPEVLQDCEHALHNLPVEDPRLKMKGRFFFDPAKKEKRDNRRRKSNSVLLSKSVNRIYWDDDEEVPKVKILVMTCQKICQTDPPEKNSVSCQTSTMETGTIGLQVNPQDLEPPRSRRSIAERLDWSKATADNADERSFGQKRRVDVDLRDSLNSQRRIQIWDSPMSPPQVPHFIGHEPMEVQEHHFPSSLFPVPMPEPIAMETPDANMFLRRDANIRSNATRGNFVAHGGGRAFPGGRGGFGGTSYQC